MEVGTAGWMRGAVEAGRGRDVEWLEPWPMEVGWMHGAVEAEWGGGMEPWWSLALPRKLYRGGA